MPEFSPGQPGSVCLGELMCAEVWTEHAQILESARGTGNNSRKTLRQNGKHQISKIEPNYSISKNKQNPNPFQNTFITLVSKTLEYSISITLNIFLFSCL